MSEETPQISKVFICYRRDTCKWPAQAIYERLTGEFGEEHIFMDLKIDPGEPFEVVIRERIDKCDVLLALIDSGWLSVEDDQGRRRLENPNDWVRVEIRLALERGIVVIPVLVDDAVMPRGDRIPENLRALVSFEAIRVRTGKDFQRDLNDLIRVVRDAPKKVAEARRAVRQFLQLWDSGDWVAAIRNMEIALGQPSTVTGRPYDVMAAKREVAMRLGDAAHAFERGDFRSAYHSLSEISDEQGPPNLPAAREVALVGAEISEMDSNAIDVAQLEALERRLEEVLAAAEEMILPGRLEVGELLRRTRLEAEYQSALRDYQDGRFRVAMGKFEKLEGYKDAGSKASVCSLCLSFFALARGAEWEKARSTLREIRGADPSAPVEKWQQWCNKARILVPALELMAAGSMVRDPRVPWSGGECPYSVLGWSPQTSIERCNELFYDLQAKPEKTQSERDAWSALRRVETRLVIDFSLYPVNEPDSARQLLEKVCSVDEGWDPESALREELAASRGVVPIEDSHSTLDLVAQALGPDRGVFYALIRNYDAAIDTFCDEICASPFDPSPFHKLGMAAAAKIRLFGDADDLYETWQHLIQGWGPIFANDRFWHGWWVERRRTYPVTGERIQDARHELQSFWLDEIRSSSELYSELATAFQTEINGARAVNAGGGIVVTEPASGRVIVGPMGATAFGLTEAIKSWTATFPAGCLEEEGWQRRVCLYFSELGEAYTLIEEGKFDQAIQAADAVRSVRGVEFSLTNPGFAGLAGGRALFKNSLLDLREQAHSKLALAAVSQYPVAVSGAIENWRKAIQLAESRDRRDACLAEIRDVAIGRAAHLYSEEREDQLEALNDAVALLQEVIDQGWDREQQVKEALVHALLNRAVFLSNKYDRESDARMDAQRAWGLEPNSLRAITVLCAVSLHDARERFMCGRRDLAEALIGVVEQRLEEGEKLYPQATELAKVREQRERLRDLMAESPEGGLRQALDDLRSTVADTVGDKERNPLAEAMLHEARMDFKRAIAVYRELVQANPEDQGLRGKMCWCYRSWIQHLQSRSGDAGEIRRITQEALESCAGFDSLSDIAGELEQEEGA